MVGPRSLFLHVGVPKCGSSALQDWAGTNRALLARQGLDWPEPEATDHMAARHQWLVNALRFGPDARLEQALAAASGDVLISAEGLSRHLDDFDPAHLEWFRAVTAGWDVRLILMTRAPGDWVRAMWKDFMLNPAANADEYGLAVGLADFAALPRVRRLGDVRRLGRDLGAAYGARDLTEIDADGDWLPALGRLLDIDLTGASAPPRRHESVSDAVVPVIRAINALAEDRDGSDAALSGPLLALLQQALDSRNDSLRALEAAHGPGLAAQAEALSAAVARLPALAEAQGGDPASALVIETMAARLDALGGAGPDERKGDAA